MFLTNILKIIVFLFYSIKISRIFVKEITTKTKEIMKTFYSPTSMNNKYEIKSYVEIPEAGKNLGGNNAVEYKGKPYFNIPFHYWVNKKQLDLIIEKYNALLTYM